MCGCQNGPHPVSRDPLGLVKVRALVWDGFRAGPYWIEVEADGIAHLFCDYDRTDEGVEPIKGGFLTLVSLDDLKAAAQRDYETRILSALEPTPQAARIPDHAAWAARGRWREAYEALVALTDEART